MNPRLQLAPHELEPHRLGNDELESNENEYEFRGRWLGQDYDFLVRTSWLTHVPAIFFALRDEPQRGNFVCCPRYYRPGKPDGELIYQLPHHQEPQRAHELLQIYCDRSWGRVWHLDKDWKIANEKPAQWRLFVTFDGWGELCAAPKFNQGECLFKWQPQKSASELAALSSSKFLGTFLPEMLNSESDAAFVQRFVQMTHDERRELLYPLKREHYPQWKHVMTLFLQSRVGLWKFEGEHLVFSSKGNAESCRILRRRAGTSSDESAQQFFGWTLDYFCPTESEVTLQHWAAKRWVPNIKGFGIKVLRPTFHEQVEALLQLRDWMSDKAPLSEIEELLGEA